MKLHRRISAAEAKRQVHDGDEIALLDVREAGQFGEGHPLFAIPAPYSTLESRVGLLVPRRDVRTLLIDDGDGVSERAAQILEEAGYRDVRIVDGGAPAWASAGFSLYKGVNVPSKTLGELVEHAWHPPTIDADTLHRWQRQGRAFRLFDARPPAEYAKMRIPGAVCLPNGELAHRFPAAVPTDDMPVVVTCAGRTRSLVGALGLRLAGIKTPVFALENGTQGWTLAGYPLERNNQADRYPVLSAQQARITRSRAASLMAAQRIRSASPAEIVRWRDATDRTTYLLDLRTPAEIASNPAPAFVPALSGQLVQAVDQWIGVRGARVVLLDDHGLRGAIAAFWLRQLGYEVWVTRMDDCYREWPSPAPWPEPMTAPTIGASTAWARVCREEAQLVDVRGSAAYRSRHLAGVPWAIRPRLGRLGLDRARPVFLVGDGQAGALAVRECLRLGHPEACLVTGGLDALANCGAVVEEGGMQPDTAAAIDYLFFVHDRHEGNLEASRRYLAWEQGLVAQLDGDERAEFRLPDVSPFLPNVTDRRP
ncbi:MAG: rhodanese [Proteobacteria bacterium]|nr:MAG: rhodanese [Pseudomonadota bacterium]